MSAHHDGTILISGGSSCLGEQIALALAAAGAPMRLWLAPGAPPPAAARVGGASWERADAWNAASLRGRGRGVALLLHCIGSLRADETRGLSAKRQNFEAARNVVNMAMQDGVPQFLLLSSAPAPWLPHEYRAAKRAAERYLARSGLRYAIIRAPLAYRAERRPFFFRALSAMAWLPGLGNWAPMPIEQLARGVAQIARQLAQGEEEAEGPGTRFLRPQSAGTRFLRPQSAGTRFLRPRSADMRADGQIYGGRDLRRLARGARDALELPPPPPPAATTEETPFGWTPT